MARFNITLKSLRTATTNLAGGQAYQLARKSELATLVLTSFVDDKYYRTAGDELTRLHTVIDGIDDLTFVARAAVYARREAGMRSISHAIAGYLPVAARRRLTAMGGRPGRTSYGGAIFFTSVVHRIDDIGEIIAAYRAVAGDGAPLPNAMKRGLATAFGRFNDYQIAKYRGESRDWKLVDVVNVLHPRPTAANGAALARLVKGELVATDTWESRLSQAGVSGDVQVAKSEAWRDLIGGRKLGHFALLRNLRNIAAQADEETFATALDQLIDPDAIRRSLVLPFRYFTASQQLAARGVRAEMGRITRARVALSRALDIAVDNAPELPGRTLVAVDLSGSMDRRLSGKSVVSMRQIASLFGAVIAKRSAADVVIFADKAIYAPINPLDSTTSITRFLAEEANRPGSAYWVGQGTNFSAIFDAALTMGSTYDRIVILSDMQSWMVSNEGLLGGNASSQKAYRAYVKRSGTTPTLVSVDLAGYGTTQFPEDRVNLIAGWSDNIFDVMARMEQGRDTLVRTIEEYELHGATTDRSADRSRDT